MDGIYLLALLLLVALAGALLALCAALTSGSLPPGTHVASHGESFDVPHGGKHGATDRGL